jgi:Holliday junction resolvasome RuvABC ATP-dependent DNA helicase subunit
LIQQGYLQRTSRGRLATARAYQHFGLPENNLSQQTLLDLNQTT